MPSPRKSKTNQTIKPPADVREACVAAARDVIAEQGVEALSLRDIARRLGVSHQAPYKHYPSRDHLLAEVMRRCYEDFARQLDARPRFDEPAHDLGSLGEAYLRYAAMKPLEYRLMFGTPWPAAADHPDLVREAVHAFDVLRGVLRRMHGGGAGKAAKVDLDAMFIWSCMHGVASISHGDVMPQLRLAPKVEGQAAAHVMQMISRAMAAG